MDERLILSQMTSDFILKLWGTYQTPHTIVMVTEVMHGGDLWAVIYETPPFYRDRGIPHKLTAFYGACLTLALSHIHAKGIVFRDLKPENVMLDDRGYLKLIDFGFAKKVPFMKKDANGEMKVFAKSYTLCGTPEYLSPELIFNLGHNQSADIWALGVMIYEMLMTITPFAPKRPDNITELFTNIAMVKKNGLILSPKMNDHTKTPHSADIIMQLLKADPAERLGVQEGSTRCILEHPFFTDVIDEELINCGKEVPSFVPSTTRKYDPISSIPPVRAYHGDQSLFAKF
jgi:serine/threonine protein kinase